MANHSVGRSNKTMLETQVPIKTFRGTLAEVLTHQNEIPPDSVIEVRVYLSPQNTEEPTLADSLAGLIEEARHVQRGEPIRYSNPRKQAVVATISQKFKKQGFAQ